ncbi:MAG: GNVR domain-containing protein, partial [Leptothrix ochracea]
MSDERIQDQETHEEVSLLDLALVLLEHRNIVLGMPLGVAVLVLGLSFLITPKFAATTQIMLPQQPQSGAAALLGSLGGGGLGGAAGAIAGLKNPADQWIGLLKSRTVQDGMVARFHLRERYESKYQFQARQTLEGLTQIKSGKDGLISISVEDHDPATAMAMADAYIDELQKLSKTLAVTEAGQRRLFFEIQLKEAKEQLIKAEVALRQSGVSESVLKTSPDAAVAVLAQIKAQVAAAEVKVAVMRGQFTTDSPDLKQAQLELTSVRSQLAKAEQNDPKSAQGSGSQYVARFREFKYQETLFELLARQFEMAKADEAKDGAIIQVVDKATLPEWKSSPKRGMMTVLAGVLSLILGTAFVLIRQALRNARERDP